MISMSGTSMQEATNLERLLIKDCGIRAYLEITVILVIIIIVIEHVLRSGLHFETRHHLLVDPNQNSKIYSVHVIYIYIEQQPPLGHQALNNNIQHTHKQNEGRVMHVRRLLLTTVCWRGFVSQYRSVRTQSLVDMNTRA